MTSRFVTLSDYCILEFMLTPAGEPIPEIINSNYYFVKNANVDLYQIYNTDDYSLITKNSRGLSIVPIGGSRLIKIDLTDIPIYTQYDPNITETAISNTLTFATVMDTMRFHFASGFNFTEVENIIVGARQKLNNLGQIQLANILLTADTYQDLLTFNPRPLFLANTIYDKYVDIKIPTCSYLDEDFIQFGQNSFEYVITEGIGFIKDSPITVSLSEANYEDYYADNGEKYEMYRVINYFEGSVPQVNEFDSLGAIIREATDGDYIEFFATWNGGFPDDLIASLNAQGVDNDWMFIHQLQVYEQIGSSSVPSGNFLIYQENNFDSALSYRPILKEAGFAIAMMIDYNVRLLNKKTGDQVIRTGSMTLFNPNKYGKQLVKLELADKPQSLKVYNKIVQTNLEVSNLFTGGVSTPTSNSTNIVYVPKEVKISVPTFYKQSNIKMSQRNALLTTATKSAEVIYGQGELIVPIDPTDNFIKFSVYEEDQLKLGTQKPTNLNTNSTFNLNFGKDGKYVYGSLKDPSIENPSIGQIAFKIPKDQAKKILDSTDQLMFISLIAENGTETLMYTGKWMDSVNYSTILKASRDATDAVLNDPSTTIAALKQSITDLQTENTKLKIDINTAIHSYNDRKNENVKTINAVSGNTGASPDPTIVTTTTIKPSHPTGGSTFAM